MFGCDLLPEHLCSELKFFYSILFSDFSRYTVAQNTALGSPISNGFSLSLSLVIICYLCDLLTVWLLKTFRHFQISLNLSSAIWLFLMVHCPHKQLLDHSWWIANWCVCTCVLYMVLPLLYDSFQSCHLASANILSIFLLLKIII